MFCTGRMSVEPLHGRRTKADLCEVYKIIKGGYELKADDYLEMVASRNRGHDVKIGIQRCGTDTRINYFSSRIVTTWNKLSETVSSPTIQIFKDRLEMETFQ